MSAAAAAERPGAAAAAACEASEDRCSSRRSMRAPRGASTPPSAAPSSGHSEADKSGGGGAAAATAAGSAEPNRAAISAKTASLAGAPPGPRLGSMPARTSAARARCDVSYAGAAVRGVAASCAGGMATGVQLSRERAPEKGACVAVPRVRCCQVLAGGHRGAVRR
jgi:hypothetical protein